MDGSRSDPGQAVTEIYKFGRYYLNPAERRLAHDGRFIDIKPRTFEVLCYLVANSGQTVTKDEILDVVWEGHFVEESNLAVHISRIRKMFEKTGAEGYIHTLSGSGYQFVESVETVENEEWKEAVSGATPLVDPYGLDEDCESIAVMPLFNENGDTEIDYLADGMTEALINNLSCRPDLRVLARNTVFRFKNEEIDVKEVGKRLNVSSVLTGRIRISDDDISLSVELCKSEDGTQLWGAKFDKNFSEIFEMQDSITNSICENLNAEIDRASRRLSSQQQTKNTESYRLYLKGKYFVNQGGLSALTRALSLFEESTRSDPLNASAYVEIANCYLWMFFYEEFNREEAIRHTERMLSHAQLIRELPEYHLLRGCISMYLDWDIANAERSLSTAINLNPNFARARYYYANLLSNQKRFKEALEQLSIIMQLDPISVVNNKNAAKIFYKMERFENAISCLDEVLDLDPNNYEALLIRGAAKTELQQYQDAIEDLQSALSLHEHPEAISMIGYCLGLMGNVEGACAAREKLRIMSKSQNVPANYFGILELGLGHFGKAIALLRKGLKTRYPDVFYTSGSSVGKVEGESGFRENRGFHRSSHKTLKPRPGVGRGFNRTKSWERQSRVRTH